MANPEHTPTRMEHAPEVAQKTHERPSEPGQMLKSSLERYNDKKAHQEAETARHEAIKEALLSNEQGKERRSHQADRHSSSHHTITNQEREAGFEQTMAEVRKHLPRSARPFSRFIHKQTIEQLSEIVGTTIARPNAILGGGITAFVVVLGAYFYAKFAGFQLSGSETIIAFVIGWGIGLLFDLCKKVLTSKR